MSIESTLCYIWEKEDETKVELELTFTMSYYDRGNTYGPPENCYPPEGGEVEVTNCDPDLPEFWEKYNNDSEFQSEIDEKCAEKGVAIQDEAGSHDWDDNL